MPTFSESGACVEADKLAQPEAAGGVSDNESDNGDDGREAYDGDEPTSADGDEGEHPEERQNFAALQDGFDDDAALQEAMRQSLVSVKYRLLACFGARAGHQHWCRSRWSLLRPPSRIMCESLSARGHSRVYRLRRANRACMIESVDKQVVASISADEELLNDASFITDVLKTLQGVDPTDAVRCLILFAVMACQPFGDGTDAMQSIQAVLAALEPSKPVDVAPSVAALAPAAPSTASSQGDSACGPSVFETYHVGKHAGPQVKAEADLKHDAATTVAATGATAAAVAAGIRATQEAAAAAAAAQMRASQVAAAAAAAAEIAAQIRGNQEAAEAEAAEAEAVAAAAAQISANETAAMAAAALTHAEAEADAAKRGQQLRLRVTFKGNIIEVEVAETASVRDIKVSPSKRFWMISFSPSINNTFRILKHIFF